jgi:hypothetical protein
MDHSEFTYFHGDRAEDARRMGLPDSEIGRARDIALVFHSGNAGSLGTAVIHGTCGFSRVGSTGGLKIKTRLKLKPRVPKSQLAVGCST